MVIYSTHSHILYAYWPGASLRQAAVAAVAARTFDARTAGNAAPVAV